MKINGKIIQIDLSNGQGHRWVDVEGTDYDVQYSNDLQEISCEIIDGKIERHDGYVTLSGTYYRWEPEDPTPWCTACGAEDCKCGPIDPHD